MATTKIIQSLERAASILELFQNQITELSLKEIVDKTELNKSTAFGIVNSLAELGYLMQNSDNQKYSLGPKILLLSTAMRMNNLIMRISHPYLENIANKYQETVHCAIDVGNASIIYLDKVESDSSLVINSKLGVKNYMHCTGVGKCLLAYKSQDELDRILSFPLTARTYNTFTQKEPLYAELAKIKELGYAMDNEEIEIGLSCVSIPVFRAADTPGFAISISGPTSRILSKLKDTDLLEYLKTTAKELSRKIYSYE